MLLLLLIVCNHIEGGIQIGHTDIPSYDAFKTVNIKCVHEVNQFTSIELTCSIAGCVIFIACNIIHIPKQSQILVRHGSKIIFIYFEVHSDIYIPIL